MSITIDEKIRRVENMLEVMKAYKEGKTVQFRVAEDLPWQEDKYITFNYPLDTEYRVKPEPMKLYCIMSPTDTPVWSATEKQAVVSVKRKAWTSEAYKIVEFTQTSEL